jgi:hypothetical protein
MWINNHAISPAGRLRHERRGHALKWIQRANAKFLPGVGFDQDDIRCRDVTPIEDSHVEPVKGKTYSIGIHHAYIYGRDHQVREP